MDSSTVFPGFLAARLDVWHVMTPCQSATEMRRVISLVGTQVLWAPFPGLRTMNKYTVQSRQCQLDIVTVGRVDDDPQHDAAGVREHRSLNPKFTAIGRIRPGFFPHPEVLCSSRCPASATARKFSDVDHTPPDHASIASATHPPCTTSGNNYGGYFPSHTLWEQPSRHNRFAIHNRCRRQHAEDPTAVDLPLGWDDVQEVTSSVATTDHRAFFDRNSQ